MATATGRVPGDHVCWPFHGVAGLVPAAREYIGEGLHRRERVVYLRLSPRGLHYADVSDPAEVGLPPAGGVPVLVPLAADPDWRPSQDPMASLGPMADAALSDGYTGLRVLTDATDMARDAESREPWVRTEHLIDRYGRRRLLTVLCAYDLDHLGDERVAEVACVHARTAGMPSPFLLHAAEDDDGGLALTGEVDRSSAGALRRAITRIGTGAPGPLVVDLSALQFIDHTGLVALHRAARALGTRIVLAGASPLIALLVDALALTELSVRVRS